jgi:sugar lactone lactonase YvrE
VRVSTVTIILTLSGLLGTTPLAWGQEQADPQAARKARLERLQALRLERPGDGLLGYYEAIMRLGLGDKAGALTELRRLVGRQLGLVPAAGLGFDALWDDAEFQALRATLAAQEPRTPDAPEGGRLTDPRLIPEGIAWDERGQRFLIGSIAQRKIVQLRPGGKPRSFSRPNDGLDAVIGLAVDAPRGWLYAVTTNGFEVADEKQRRNAVVRYDLKQRRLVARLPVPEAVQLNDVTVARDGGVYASDSGGGSVFHLAPGAKAFTHVGEAGSLRGANGLTVAPDGRLYVTLSTGIARVDAGQAERLPQPDDVVTGGIDGLYWHEGDLLGVQNGCNPGRVIRVRLADAGRRIAGVDVLQSHHHPAFDEPTTGALRGAALYVIANSFVARYQPDGSFKDPATLKPTVLLAVPVRR